MSDATQSIFPIEHGKLTTDLDANNLQILNLDTSNLPVGEGGGNTGTTTAILKGDGSGGFDDAVAGVDYESPGALDLKEDISDHDADLLVVTENIQSLQIGVGDLSTQVAGKADTDDVTTALALKTDETDFQAYITSNDAAVALKADSDDVTAALAAKADSSATASALAGKENLLPFTSSDGFVLVRDTDLTWRFVDPVTLGSTNATYADGSTHSNTTFNSTLAVFTTNDTGKTIVSSPDIPDDTTITFVNATTVTLSNAATTTASGLTFVILNRFLPSGSSGGTVTSVGVNPSSPTLVSELFAITVGNASTTPVLTFDSAIVGANRFYGNFSAFAGTAAFGTAAAARTSLGGSSIGQSVFQLPNSNAAGYIALTAGNTAVTRTTAQTLGDLGAEAALTFSPIPPFSRSGNTISMAQAAGGTPGTAGFLSAADYNTFAAKISGTTTITTTAPLSIGGVSGGSANLTANRTIAIPVSTDLADGYLSAADHALFVAKPPNSRTLAVTQPLTMSPGTVSGNTTTGDLSANRTVAIPRATTLVDGYLAATDFNKFSVGAGIQQIVVQGSPVGTVTVPEPSPLPVTKILLTAVLGQPTTILLPSATGYSAVVGTQGIELMDIVGGATATNAITVTPASGSGQLIDGTTSIVLAKGSSYQRFFSNGAVGAQGKWFSTKYYVDAFKDPTDPTKIARVDLAAQTPALPPTLATASTAWPPFYSGFTTATTRTMRPAPGADSVTVVPYDGGTSSVDGSYNGQGVIYDYDANGRAKRTQVSGTPDPGGHEAEVLTVVSGVAAWSGNDSLYQTLTPAAIDGSNANITWVCTPHQQRQNAVVTLNRTTSNLLITGAQEGMHFSLYATQGIANAALNPPAGSATNKADGTGGAGALPDLSTTLNAVDHVEGDYINELPSLPYAWSVTQKNLTRTAAASCNVGNNMGPANTAVAVFTLWTSVNENGFLWVSNLFNSVETTTICRVDVSMFRTGSPNYALDVAIYGDTFQPPTITNGVTTGTNNSITSTTGGWSSATHLGCRITCPTIPTVGNSAYIGSVVSTNEVTLVSTRGGSTPVTPTAGTALTVVTFGLPNTAAILATSTNAVNSGSLPQYATQAGATAAGQPNPTLNADANPTIFTFTGGAAVTAGTDYHMVLHQSGSPLPSSLHNVSVLNLATGSTITGYSTKRSATGTSTSFVNLSARRIRFQTYRAS